MSQSDTEKTYYAMIPKLASIELNPYELALYTNYMQTCGQCGGECKKSNATLASETHMSVRQVQKMRKALAQKGYIEVLSTGNESPPRVKIIATIWQRNTDTYSRKQDAQQTPPMNQVHTPVNQVHTPHESGANKEEPKNKNLSKKKKENAPTREPMSTNSNPDDPVTTWNQLWDEIEGVFRTSGYDTTDRSTRGLIGKIRIKFKDNNLSPSDVKPLMREAYARIQKARQRKPEIGEYLWGSHFAEYKRQPEQNTRTETMIDPDWRQKLGSGDGRNRASRVTRRTTA